MEKCYTEADWKLFKGRIAEWQESYMEKLNRGYIELLSSDAPASERFWELEKSIKHDRRDAGVCLVMRRSALASDLARLLSEGAITADDLDGFSVQLKEAVLSLAVFQ